VSFSITQVHLEIGKTISPTPVKRWRDLFLLDLESLPVPSYEEVYDTSDSEHPSSLEDSSEDDSSSDGWFDKFVESDNEASCLSITDDDDVNITRTPDCSSSTSFGTVRRCCHVIAFAMHIISYIV